MNDDAYRGTPAETIRRAINKALLETRTITPGQIVSYNARTRRASVWPTVNMRMIGGAGAARPVISDVPVIIPSNPREVVHLPLRRGDPVLLLISDRSLAAWKGSFSATTPPRGYSFSLRDSLAIPIGPAGDVDPAVSDALCLQTADGKTYISLKDGEIDIVADRVRVNGVEI